jgi:hypothetical protein
LWQQERVIAGPSVQKKDRKRAGSGFPIRDFNAVAHSLPARSIFGHHYVACVHAFSINRT